MATSPQSRGLSRVSALTGAVMVLAIGWVGVSVAAGTGTVNPPPSFAFVATAGNFPDALAAGPIAGRLGAPLFITPRDVLDDSAAAGLEKFDPDVVVIAGGLAAISQGVQDQIVALLPDATIRRAAGAGRTETALLLADVITDYDPAFLPVSATATDSDLFDGLDSTAFVRSDGSSPMSGELHAPDVRYTAMQTRTETIPMQAFNGDCDLVYGAAGLSCNSGITVLFAPVSLPSGATITGMDVYVNDSSGAIDLKISLFHAAHLAHNDVEVIAEATSSGNPGLVALSSQIANHAVRNDRLYALEVSPVEVTQTSWDGLSASVRAVVITYEVGGPS